MDLCEGENNQAFGSWCVVLCFGRLHRSQSRASSCYSNTTEKLLGERESEREEEKERDRDREKEDKTEEKQTSQI